MNSEVHNLVQGIRLCSLSYYPPNGILAANRNPKNG